MASMASLLGHKVTRLLPRQRRAGRPGEGHVFFVKRHASLRRNFLQRRLLSAWRRRANLLPEAGGGAHKVDGVRHALLRTGDPRRAFEAGGDPEALPALLIARQRLAKTLSSQLDLALSERQVPQVRQRLRAPSCVVRLLAQLQTVRERLRRKDQVTTGERDLAERSADVGAFHGCAE